MVKVTLMDAILIQKLIQLHVIKELLEIVDGIQMFMSAMKTKMTFLH